MALDPELARKIVEFRQAQTALLDYHRNNGTATVARPGDLIRIKYRLEAKIAALVERVSVLFGEEAERQVSSIQSCPDSSE